MSCTFQTEELSAWIDGDLEPAMSRAVAAHVEECTSCQAAAADLRALRAAARGLGEQPIPEDDWEALRPRVEASSRRRRWLRRAPLALAAAASLAVVLGVALFSHRDQEQTAESLARARLTLLMDKQEQTIAAVEEVVRRKRASWDPKMKETYARTAALLDSALDECRRAVRHQPGDVALQASLVEAYQRKTEFLKLFSGLEEEP